MSLIYSPPSGGIKSSKLTYPGIDHNAVHRRELHYQDACKVNLQTNDLITIENHDGVSQCLILVQNENNDLAFEELDLLQLENQSIEPTRFKSSELSAYLQSCQLDIKNITTKVLFDDSCKPNERITLKSKNQLTLWLIFPKLNDDIWNGGGGSFTITVSPHTSNPYNLPEPLATVKEEFLVPRASAKAYTVKKGEYIQIIDIEGQQCSDFMAMRSDALEKGEERYIDSNVTRTLVAGAYPRPGLFDKFYDQDMQPLLRVVQDTVGRHDTFALACTARGYEERGYPGHLNCSDNISAAYKPYGIKPKIAWPAINFFFNSQISIHNNHLTSEESWSRPGDYVVMQALTDLVCVSTACPDDIDPINGWNPTDIFVRIYTDKNEIPKAIAHRPFVESQATMTTNSPFHAKTSQLTQSYQVARDLWLPSKYDATTAIEEYWACSQTVTIQDMSSLRKYDINGPDAEKLLQIAMTRDISKLSVFRGIYTLICTDSGSVIDDGTLFRLAPDLFRWCCGSEESAKQLKNIAEQNNLRVWIKGLGSAMPNLAIQGPKSRELLSRIIFTQPAHPALENIKWFGCTIARLHDRNGPAFMLTRSGFTGELGYEIFCNANDAEEIWDAIMIAGKDLGFTTHGCEALEMKRIEAGLMISGAEFTPDVDAFESGLGFAVDLNKKSFIGKEALERNSQSTRKKLIGLSIDANEIPVHGSPIYAGRHQIGVITSATYSPELEKTIALARIAIEHSDLENEVEVGCLDGHIKRLSAHVCGFPFVDPKRERARA